MNQLDFTFEKTPWELFYEKLPNGGILDAVRFLMLMESETEENIEAAFAQLDEKDILLDIESLEDFAGSGDTAVRLRFEKQLVSDNKLPAGLEQNDPLRLYLEEIAALPVCGDVQVLAERYLAGDESVVPQLTNLMLASVVEQACALVGRGVLLLDLMQEGGMGLWQAILSYQGGDFESCCKRSIQRTLHKALVQQARQYGVGQRMRQAMEDYRAVDERLLADLGRNPTLQEIAEEMHMTVEETQSVSDMLAAARMLSSAKQEMEEPEETPEDAQHVEDTAYYQSRQVVNDLLDGLTEQEAKLIALRFGLNGGQPLSPEEASRKLGLTPEEVVAIETAALEKMRKQ